MRTRFLLLLGLAAPTAASAQLGMQPVEQWAITLESGRRMERLEIEKVVASIGLKPGEVVADIGAGTGIFSVPLAMAVGPSGQVLSVEVAPGFIPMIEEKARANHLANMKAVLGEFTDPKLPRRDVTVAFFHDVLHHVQDRPGYLKTLATYMAPGSRIAIVDYIGSDPTTPHQDAPEMLITPDMITGWMGEAGFRLERTVDLSPEKFYGIYVRER